jgi:Cu-Zn family superoxide dismutase
MNAVATFMPSPINSAGISGAVRFHQCVQLSLTTVEINLKGFKPNQTHAIHIHEFGDLTDSCTSLGGHFNPFNKQHGYYKINGNDRHAGDLINNIKSDAQGDVNIIFKDPLLSLFSSSTLNIIGRSVVIHEKPDDLGLGGTLESKTTGSAGKRIACSVIGLSKPSKCY